MEKKDTTLERMDLRINLRQEVLRAIDDVLPSDMARRPSPSANLSGLRFNLRERVLRAIDKVLEEAAKP